MAEYLSYEEYLERGGTLGEADFRRLAARAKARIDALTYGRLRTMEEAPDAVKEAMMSAIGVIGGCGAEAMAASGAVASFTTDGYSESYQGADERAVAVNRALNRELVELLAGVTDESGVSLTYAGGVEA